MKHLACIGIVSAAILLSTCQPHEDEAPTPIPPVAAFTFTGPFTTNDSVRFTNSSTDAVSYRWDFGDGNSSTKVAPAHRYQQPGQYTIRLDATNPGGTQSQTTSITISQFTQPPVAAFTFTGPFTTNDSVRFTNNSTDAVSYRWDFGDGNSSTKVAPAHRYQQPGQYTIRLDATNPGGTQSQTTSITISQFTLPPVAAFTCIGPFTAGDTTKFTNESTNATDYRWDFGDGSTSTDSLPMHIYQQPGQYTVQLTAANSGGTHYQTRDISVFLAPAGSSCNCKIITYTATTPRIRLPNRVILVSSYEADGFSFERYDYQLIRNGATRNDYRSTVFFASIGGSGRFQKDTDSLFISFHSGGIGNPTYVDYRCKRK